MFVSVVLSVSDTSVSMFVTVLCDLCMFWLFCPVPCCRCPLSVPISMFVSERLCLCLCLCDVICV